jgi:hypothetical protein
VGKSNTILKAAKRSFTDTGVTVSNPSFIYYQGQLRTSQLTNGPQTGTSSDYTGLDFPPLYPTVLPARLGKDYVQATQTFANVVIAPPQELTWGQNINPGAVVVVGKDIIGMGNVSIQNVTKTKPGQKTPPPTPVNFYCHYDGARWQLWPSGFYPIISGRVAGSSSGGTGGGSGTAPTGGGSGSSSGGPPPPSPSPTPTTAAVAPAANGTNTSMALGGYNSTTKLLRRYQVIVTEDL